MTDPAIDWESLPSSALVEALGLGDSVKLLKEMMRFEKESDRREFVLDQPILLAPAIHAELESRLTEPGAGSERLLPALSFVEALSEELHAHPEAYGMAHGPIERLWGRQHFGWMREDDARALLRWERLGRALTDPYLTHVSDLAAAWIRSGRAQDGGELAEFTAVVTDAFGFQPAHTRAVQILLTGATTASIEAPQPRLYRAARHWGRQLLEVAERANDEKLVEDLLYQLSSLHLRPYIVGRTSAEPEFAQWMWVRRHEGSGIQSHFALPIWPTPSC